MYYLLNYIPLILHMVVLMMPIKMNFVVFFSMYLFAQPMYLLIVNIPLLCKKSISYIVSIICMTSVIILNVLYIMILHKIQTGYFIGDVPEQIYYLLFIVPTFIILLGVLMVYVKDNR